MARLPKPGSDQGVWGDILNDYLLQSHNADGLLKKNSVLTVQISDGAVSEAKLSSAVRAKLNTVAGAPDWNAITNKPNVIAAGDNAAAAKAKLSLTKSDVGLSNVDNTSDATKNSAVASLKNKTLDNTNTITLYGSKFTLQDQDDATKQARFQLSNIASATTRTYTLPDKSDTLATLSDIASSILTPEQYGAVGDGATDDTAALQSMFAAAEGKTIYIASGKTYAHAGLLTIGVDTVRIMGGGTLLATNEEASAVMVTGDHVLIEDIVLKMASTTQRWTENEKMKLFVSGDYFYGRDIVIDGSAAAGIMMNGASHFTLLHCKVFDTRADGVHVTNGSADGVIIGCHCHDTADDAFAVVSYEADSARCRNIMNIGSYAKNSDARGFSIVGGENIRYYNGRVDGSSAAAIYVACEPSVPTYGVSDVVVDGFEIYNANFDAATTNNGAVLVYNGRTAGSLVERVTIRNITLTNTSTDATRQVALSADINGADNIRDIIIDAIDFVGTGPVNLFDAYQVPQHRFQVDASLLPRRVYVTSTYTAYKNIDQVLLVGPGGSVVLPTAVRNVNRYTVKNVHGSDITVSASDGQTIDDSESIIIGAGASYDFLSDGANWFTYS